MLCFVFVLQVKDEKNIQEMFDLSDYEKCEELRKSKSRSKKNHSKFTLAHSRQPGNTVRLALESVASPRKPLAPGAGQAASLTCSRLEQSTQELGDGTGWLELCRNPDHVFWFKIQECPFTRSGLTATVRGGERSSGSAGRGLVPLGY